MKFIFKKFLIAFFLILLLAMPMIASAQGIVPCGQGDNPSNACTLCHLIIGINNIIKFGSSILITVAAVGIFISGVMYILSSGSEEAMKNAKSFLGASLKGFAIVLGAWLIVNVVMWMLSYNTDFIDQGSNWYTFTCSTTSSTSK